MLIIWLCGGGGGSPIDIAYSGGKDSDVILQLAKEVGLNYRAVYKMTTIDPPGTLRHVKEMGVEVLRPKRNFFEIMEKKGYPNRLRRFCCSELKEYKVMDKVIIGVRKAESRARMGRYNEPTECRWFGSKKDPNNHVEQIYPILEWDDYDVKLFLEDRGIKCAPVYYDEAGRFHVERRLGCMCCPLQSYKKRLEEFKKYPNMVKAYIRAGQKYHATHKKNRRGEDTPDAYKMFYRDVMCRDRMDFEMKRNGLFGEIDYKAEIEKYFNIKL